MKKIKNKDVARELGISPAAVSLALSGKPGVSNETRKKVLDYIAAHGDTSNHLTIPEGIASISRSIILCIYKKHGSILIEKPFFSGLLEAVQAEALANGYTLNVFHTEAGKNIQQLNQMGAEGIILLATEMTEEDLKPFLSLKVPFVLVDSYFDLYQLNSVSIDDENAVFSSYNYAHSMGHRRIGYLASEVIINNFIHRFDGYCKARRLFKADTSDDIVFCLPTSIEGAEMAFSEKLKTLPDNYQMPTCFIADLDYIAIGAMRALKKAGYRIPEDISIIGFDNVDSSQVCEPKLTTIHLHQKVIGREALRLLLSIISTSHETPLRILVGCELIERDSVRKL